MSVNQPDSPDAPHNSLVDIIQLYAELRITRIALAKSSATVNLRVNRPGEAKQKAPCKVCGPAWRISFGSYARRGSAAERSPGQLSPMI